MAALPAAAAAGPPIPEWVRPAVRTLAAAGHLDKDAFQPKKPMTRQAFKQLITGVFGRGYKRTGGNVTAREVDAALVRALGKAPVAKALANVKSPDGWDPKAGMRFGTEIVAREMGLRRDRPTNQEALEASAGDEMTQADIVWSVWKARAAPNVSGADALTSFTLPNLKPEVRRVVKFAFRQVGKPYVWGGEWPTKTPAGYPYGAQSHGGFDCSGFSWFVLREGSSGWNPPGRPYAGWSIAERASYDMARGTKDKVSYRKLKPGDLMFFGSEGRDSKASDVFHAGVYLGNGWMIDSSGSQAGVSLSDVRPGSWWRGEFAWARRVIRS